MSSIRSFVGFSMLILILLWLPLSSQSNTQNKGNKRTGDRTECEDRGREKGHNYIIQQFSLFRLVRC
jgi:hypothetical protein